ncbi:MAG TPA: glycosyltransferase family 39 protein [Rickettsiales bacterium]|nr:glycosyltransferase family 39 protein [Rickettsiales bacterium]
MCRKIFERSWANWVAIALLAAVLFGIGLGGRPYSAPSESRYIEIGREMAESGDYVTPRLDYVKYFEKPALFYWVQAASSKYLGIDPFSARVPTAFFAVLLCVLTYLLGEMLYDRLTGWLSASILATTLYVFALSRIVLVDMPVSVFLVATLSAFLYAATRPAGSKRTVVIYAMYAAAAGAVLSKGLIGMVLPGAIVLVWLAMTKKWKLLAEMRIPTGLVLFLLIAVPWHVLVVQRNADFLQFYFVREHFQRYLTKIEGRYQPPWFFVTVLVAGLFPWVSFAWQGASSGLKGFWEARKTDGVQLFLVIWMVFIFVFFSLSDSKLIPYILPIWPPLTVLIGRYFAGIWREQEVKGFGIGFAVLLLLLAATAIMPSVFAGTMDRSSKVMVAIEQGGDDVRNFSLVAMFLAASLLVTYIQGKRHHLVIAMIVAAGVLVQMGDMVASHYNKDSMEKIAGAIKQLDKPGDEVVLFDEYYQDLPIYLARKVSVVSWQGTELTFGATHGDTAGWMINDEEFWKRWLKDDHLMFVVMREESYKRVTKDKSPQELHLYGVTQSGRNILFMNQLSNNTVGMVKK